MKFLGIDDNEKFALHVGISQQNDADNDSSYKASSSSTRSSCTNEYVSTLSSCSSLFSQGQVDADGIHPSNYWTGDDTINLFAPGKNNLDPY